MASLHSGSAWTDLDAVSKALPSATAVALKQIIISLNMECGTHMIRTNNIARWKTAKAIIDEARLPVAAPVIFCLYMPITSMSSLPPRPPASSSAGYSMAPNPAHIPLPPSRSGSTFGSPYPTNYPAAFRFKPSPFFTIDQVVSTVLECPESFSATDRRECTLNFQLNDDQLAKLKMPGSGYQLRLFCTSSKFYFSTATTTIDCPIEFPQTCEVYVNDVQVKTALLKGIKKRPGTAPPPELAPVGSRNAVRMIYINGGQGQLEYKKYYLVVQLVKTTSVSALVDHLLKTRFVSGADIRRQMVASMSKDDDIIAGSLKMSLKCPVGVSSYSSQSHSLMSSVLPHTAQLHAHHYALPVRKCTHSQCFDATSWYSMMEQTTTWLCPVCENVLDWRELIIDGFFAEILKTTPDSVDDVLVEADGEWSTSDGMYSSAKVASGVPFLAPYDYIDSDSD
ncbi:PINIT domain-containing protein [Mycena olivaceomarginata]|nr:PINIT domain-containing protein [Mycena olivaceomarginata]